MSIPIHNLYDFIGSIAKSKVLMKYFFPFGEKSLFNCIWSKHMADVVNNDNYNGHQDNIFYKQKLPNEYVDYVPLLICYDQEPLNFELYNQDNTSSFVEDYNKDRISRNKCTRNISHMNLRMLRPSDYHKKVILLHSDINSNDLKKYKSTGEYELAYCWTNAILSIDWFRYAEYDTELLPASNIKKTFLTYSRAENGLRVYRKKFKQLVNSTNLRDQCQWQSFNVTKDSPDLSAIYSSEDINNTMISVVLETVFDQRIHLTEKTLRPIACGHPFILVSGPGSLEHLKSYGFKTFDPYINESYDKEIDDQKRMQMVVDEMKRINNLSDSDKKHLLENFLAITEHNKQLFFSKTFINLLIDQLTENFEHAYNNVKHDLCWKKLWTHYKERKNLDYTSRLLNLTLIKHLKKGGTLEDYVPPNLN
jgi:hypothetical protein